MAEQLNATERDRETAERIMVGHVCAGKTILTEVIAGELAAARREERERCVQALWERMGREEYGHAKAAVALDIEAIRDLDGAQ